MKKESYIEETLDDCLNRLTMGETIPECVSRYPECEDEIVGLLQVAESTMQVVSSVTYSPGAKTRGFNRFMSAVHRISEPTVSGFSWLVLPQYAFRPLLGAIALVFFTMATIFGTSVVSAETVPGDIFYPIKIIKEDISLMMIRSDVSKAREHVHLARVRGEEIEHLVSEGRTIEVGELGGRIAHHLGKSAEVLGVNVSTNPIEMPRRWVEPSRKQEADKLIKHLRRDGDNLKVVLEQHIKSSGSDKFLVSRVVWRSRLRYEALISAFEGSGVSKGVFKTPEIESYRGY